MIVFLVPLSFPSNREPDRHLLPLIGCEKKERKKSMKVHFFCILLVIVFPVNLTNQMIASRVRILKLNTDNDDDHCRWLSKWLLIQHPQFPLVCIQSSYSSFPSSSLSSSSHSMISSRNNQSDRNGNEWRTFRQEINHKMSSLLHLTVIILSMNKLFLSFPVNDSILNWSW